MNARIFATGNNLVIAGDLTGAACWRHWMPGSSGRNCAHFNIDVIEEAHLHRGVLVIAALTVLRAWQVARAAGDRVQCGSLSAASWTGRAGYGSR